MEEYIENFNFEMAEKFCVRILETSPNNVRALNMVAAACLEIGKTDEAIYVSFHLIFCAVKSKIWAHEFNVPSMSIYVRARTDFLERGIGGAPFLSLSRMF